MRAALVGAVDFNEGHFRTQRFDCVIAVDRGYASLKRAGIFADLAVGDFDSLGFEPACSVRRHPVEKDASDMELAADEARARGCSELLLYGAFAARLDHTLANLQLLVHLARQGVRAFGIGDGFAVTALHGEADTTGEAGESPCSQLSFDGEDLLYAGLSREGHADDPVYSENDLPPRASAEASAADYGNFVSVFSVAGTARGVTERGLKYVLEGALLPDAMSRGLSNEFTASDALISIADGDLIVTFPLAAWPALQRG